MTATRRRHLGDPDRVPTSSLAAERRVRHQGPGTRSITPLRAIREAERVLQTLRALPAICAHNHVRGVEGPDLWMLRRRGEIYRDCFRREADNAPWRLALVMGLVADGLDYALEKLAALEDL